jgi:hypothetical protein
VTRAAAALLAVCALMAICALLLHCDPSRERGQPADAATPPAPDRRFLIIGTYRAPRASLTIDVGPDDEYRAHVTVDGGPTVIATPVTLDTSSECRRLLFDAGPPYDAHFSGCHGAVAIVGAFTYPDGHKLRVYLKRR